MDNRILKQLAELSKAFDKLSTRPVICGGLGIYLTFYNDSIEELRVTNDVDLILTQTQLLDQAHRNAIAEIITEELKYVVCEGGEHFRFRKNSHQHLDVLAPPVDGLKIAGERLRIVKSKLHGHIVPEACFIEEDLRTIPLPDISIEARTEQLEVCVPSLTNQLILKIFAFHDRNQGRRQDSERAQVHAWDIYIIVTLAKRSDYLEGQMFLARHKDSQIIQKTVSIVNNNFSSIEQEGWRQLIETSSFYPNQSVQQKRARLDQAKRRLARWFTTSANGNK